MDRLSCAARSANMSRIRSAGTSPETRVETLLRALGYRFKTHASELPGKPDIVFGRRRKIVFVHGCFWHQHRGCVDGRVPASRKSYWNLKLEGNVARDKKTRAALRRSGWDVLVVWECQTTRVRRLQAKLQQFLGPVRVTS